MKSSICFVCLRDGYVLLCCSSISVLITSLDFRLLLQLGECYFGSLTRKNSSILLLLEFPFSFPRWMQRPLLLALWVYPMILECRCSMIWSRMSRTRSPSRIRLLTMLWDTCAHLRELRNNLNRRRVDVCGVWPRRNASPYPSLFVPLVIRKCFRRRIQFLVICIAPILLFPDTVMPAFINKSGSHRRRKSRLTPVELVVRVGFSLRQCQQFSLRFRSIRSLQIHHE